MPNDNTDYIAAQEFSRAYAQLSSNRALQLTFPVQAAPNTPRWLGVVLRFFKMAEPATTVLLVIALIMALAGLVFVLSRATLLKRKWSKPLALALPAEGGVEWRPEAARALILLQDADRLAADNQFTQAVHLLLLRSVQDIQVRHPGLVRPAYTSRDIAQLERLSQSTRSAFATMAEVVEQSLFGGRPISAEAFARCRETYEGFAFPAEWSYGNLAS